MADGNWTAAAYVDERADDRQMQAQGAIVTGAAGGPMTMVAPMIGIELGAKKASIGYQICSKKRSVEIRGLRPWSGEGACLHRTCRRYEGRWVRRTSSGALYGIWSPSHHDRLGARCRLPSAVRRLGAGRSR
ncbi:DUF1326 domain-containing protein [Mesorhizobium australafricanum]